MQVSRRAERKARVKVIYSAWSFVWHWLEMLRLKMNEVKNMQIIPLFPQYPGCPPNLPISKTKTFFVDAQWLIQNSQCKMRCFRCCRKSWEAQIPLFTGGSGYMTQRGTTDVLYSVSKSSLTSLSWKQQNWPRDMSSPREWQQGQGHPCISFQNRSLTCKRKLFPQNSTDLIENGQYTTRMLKSAMNITLKESFLSPDFLLNYF